MATEEENLIEFLENAYPLLIKRQTGKTTLSAVGARLYDRPFVYVINYAKYKNQFKEFINNKNARFVHISNPNSIKGFEGPIMFEPEIINKIIDTVFRLNAENKKLKLTTMNDESSTATDSTEKTSHVQKNIESELNIISKRESHRINASINRGVVSIMTFISALLIMGTGILMGNVPSILASLSSILLIGANHILRYFSNKASMILADESLFEESMYDEDLANSASKNATSFRFVSDICWVSGIVSTGIAIMILAAL